MGKIHRDFPRGKRVLVILRNSKRFVGKFISSDSTGATFSPGGHIKNRDIRAMTIYKRSDKNGSAD